MIRLDAPHPSFPPRSLVLAGLQLGLLVLLIYACARTVLPLMGILLWSIILAVMLHPLHVRLSASLGNRWSATVIGLVGVVGIMAPTAVVATSLASSLATIASGLQNHTFVVPPPPPKLALVPLVGTRLTEAWALVGENVPAAVAKYGPMARAPAAWMAKTVGRLAAAELSFVVSFGIAAVLVAYASGATAFSRRLLHLVTGSAKRSVYLIQMTASTIRGVALGIVGVAAIQALLLGVGFFAIGLPGAGLVTLAVFLLGIVQVPATLLTLPVIAYVFASEPVTLAAFFAVWTLAAGLSDNVLKPLMLGRGLDVPMPVIFVGVIGGVIADGLLGLFVGPVLLAIGYVLFVEWLREQPVGEDQTAVASP